MMRRKTRITCLLALAGACLAGCGSTTASGGDDALRTAPSAVIVSSGPAQPSPTMRSSSPEPTSSAVSLVPARDGDIDGDGRPDAVTVRHVGAVWRLTVTMTRLGTQSLELSGTTGLPVSVEGVVDLDRDGRAEISLEIDHGASTTFSSIVRLNGDQLAQLRRPDGSVAKLDSGGSVTHIEDWGCRPSSSGSPWQLWQWSGVAGTMSGAAPTYSGTEDILMMHGDTLVTVSSMSFRDQRPPTPGCGSLEV